MGSETRIDFFLNNLMFNDLSLSYKYRSNMPALDENFDVISNFDLVNYSPSYHKKIQVVRSSKSQYILEKDIQAFESLFPKFCRKNTLYTLDSHHYIHLGKPIETLDHLLKVYD